MKDSAAASVDTLIFHKTDNLELERHDAWKKIVKIIYPLNWLIFDGRKIDTSKNTRKGMLGNGPISKVNLIRSPALKQEQLLFLFLNLMYRFLMQKSLKIFGFGNAYKPCGQILGYFC